MSQSNAEEKSDKRDKLKAVTGIGDKTTIESLGRKEAAMCLIALERLRSAEKVAKAIEQNRAVHFDSPELSAIALSNMEDMEAAHKIEPFLAGAFCGSLSMADFLQRWNDLHMGFISIASE